VPMSFSMLNWGEHALIPEKGGDSAQVLPCEQTRCY
jgi:hypothetical protein